MSERAPEDFVRAAEIRLALAAEIYGRGGELPFIDRYVEMANVAMLVWSAGIDLISAHMMSSGEASLGTSVSRRRYLRSQVLAGNWPDRLLGGWGVLARLHNFQHNLSMAEFDFTDDCHVSAQMLAGLNGLLPATIRLPPDAYAWLADVG